MRASKQRMSDEAVMRVLSGYRPLVDMLRRWRAVGAASRGRCERPERIIFRLEELSSCHAAREAAMSRTLLWLALLAPLLAAAAQPAGVVKIAQGQVAIERDGDKQAAVPGLKVHAGDRIVTGADGRIGITLDDNTLLSAGPNAVVVLDRFAFDSTTHAGVLDASVQRGTLAVSTGKIGKQSPETVRFRTPNAILGVRGTSFAIDAGEGAR
jgi:hypothetical protein